MMLKLALKQWTLQRCLFYQSLRPSFSFIRSSSNLDSIIPAAMDMRVSACLPSESATRPYQAFDSMRTPDTFTSLKMTPLSISDEGPSSLFPRGMSSLEKTSRAPSMTKPKEDRNKIQKKKSSGPKAKRTCPFCKQVFPWVSNMNKHKNSLHPYGIAQDLSLGSAQEKASRKNHECSQCASTFTSVYNRNDHQKKCSG